MSQAHLCAQLSQIVYASPRDWDDLVKDLGLDIVAKYDRGGTQAVLVTDSQLAILPWRGTDNWGDVRSDLNYVKTDFPGGGRVHSGFYEVFKQIADEARLAVEKLGLPVVQIGHSLGAAPATMAAIMWGAHQLHVFGSPRVGNKVFAKRLECPGRRYENWLDPVTYIPPPSSPRQAFHAVRHGRMPTLYSHVDKKISLNGFGHSVSQYVKATT